MEEVARGVLATGLSMVEILVPKWNTIFSGTHSSMERKKPSIFPFFCVTKHNNPNYLVNHIDLAKDISSVRIFLVISFSFMSQFSHENYWAPGIKGP